MTAMTIDTSASTFEFTRDWLAGSEVVRHDVLGGLNVEDARAKVYREEVLVEPAEDLASQTAPDQPPAVNQRPLIVVATSEDERRRVGTGTWAGEGVLLIAFEVRVPPDYVVDWNEDDAEAKAETFAARREWGAQLCKSVRDDLLETSGRGDEQGNPYLNATEISIYQWPADPEEGEAEDFIGFTLEVRWR